MLQALAIHKKALGEQHPNYATTLNNLASLYARTDRWQEASEQFHTAQRVLCRYLERTLPAVADNEQQRFLRSNFLGSFHVALSISWQRRAEGGAERGAEWLLNGKAVGYRALAERVRLYNNKKLRPQLLELATVRQQLSNLSLQPPRPGQERAYRERLAQLTEQEETLAKVLGREMLADERADPWRTVTELRTRLPRDTVLVDFARFSLWDFKIQGTATKWQPARYVAWVVPPAGKGEVRLVDLGLASDIERAIQVFRTAMKNAPQLLVEVGDEDATKKLHEPLGVLSKQLLQPLYQELAPYRRWVMSPDRWIYASRILTPPHPSRQLPHPSQQRHGARCVW